MISAMPVTARRAYKSTHNWDFEKENKLAPYPCVTCLWARRVLRCSILTLIVLMWRIGWAHNNARK